VSTMSVMMMAMRVFSMRGDETISRTPSRKVRDD
jgi:hypothetical protein